MENETVELLRAKHYRKVCLQCGGSFESVSKDKRICDSCKEKNARFAREREYKANKKPKPKPAKVRPTADIELIPLVRLIDRYNERNGTCYSYGKFMQLVRLKKINIRKEMQSGKKVRIKKNNVSLL